MPSSLWVFVGSFLLNYLVFCLRVLLETPGLFLLRGLQRVLFFVVLALLSARSVGRAPGSAFLRIGCFSVSSS